MPAHIKKLVEQQSGPNMRRIPQNMMNGFAIMQTQYPSDMSGSSIGMSNNNSFAGSVSGVGQNRLRKNTNLSVGSTKITPVAKNSASNMPINVQDGINVLDGKVINRGLPAR